MDDDLRSRYRVPRRDYNQPARRPYQPQHRPVHHPQPQPVPKTEETFFPIHQHASKQPPPTPIAYQPEPAPATRHKSQTHRRKRRWPKLVLALVVIAALTGSGVWAYPKYIKPPNPFPANVQSSTPVSLLYPGKLPTGFTVDKSSIKLVNGSLLYAANDDSLRLVFTLQKTPPTLNFASFYKQQLHNSEQFNTAYGQATLGKYDTRYLGSLVAGKTWLLLSTNSPDVSMDDMSLVLHNLKQY